MAKKTRKKQSGTQTLATLIIGVLIVIAGFFASLIGGGDNNVTPTSAPGSTQISTVTTNQPATTAPGLTPAVTTSGSVTSISIPLGFGAQKGFWQAYFTAPTGSRDPATYIGGIDTQLVTALNNVRSTLDIAAFEFNNVVLTEAVLAAHQRGVRIRMVTDNEHGLNDRDTTIGQFVAAGIPVVDDGRSALMHNKFMILDSTYVWTGSWNYTINDTYRNNNNALSIRSQQAVQNYQREFNEMFEQRRFGPRSPADTPFPRFSQDGVAIQIYFSPEDKVLVPLIATLSQAQHSIRFMNFSFTDYDAAKAMMDRATAGVAVQGIWETTGSETEASELRTMFCAGLQVRQDGNPFILHHKVFIIDDQTIISGSFNISSNATQSNDENLIIITDPDLAALYITEFDRRWAEAKVPTRLTCQ